MSPTRIILAASAGNALEFYDFTVFGYFVPQISDAFFPSHNPTTSLLFTWGTYGTAFLARPLGALALGSYADRSGRRNAMSLAIILMTLGTALVAVMPRFESIGVLAPLGILVARLIQGFSTGGEFGGATAFMLEHGNVRRGFMASFQFTSQSVSMIAGAGVGWLVSVMMSAHALHDWGFRVPFAIGLLIGPVGLYLRRHTDETAAFREASHASRPARTVMVHHPVGVLLAACTLAAGTAATYTILYLPTYAQTELHMKASDSYLLSVFGSVMSLAITPLSAHLSDRIGRLLPSIGGVLLLLVFAYPSFVFIAALAQFATVAAAATLLGVLRSFYSAPLPALFGEMFPTSVRGVGMSVSYALGILLFGSVTPFMNTWGVATTGLKSFPGMWLTLFSVVSLASLLIIRRKYVLEDDRFSSADGRDRTHPAIAARTPIQPR